MYNGPTYKTVEPSNEDENKGFWDKTKDTFAEGDRAGMILLLFFYGASEVIWLVMALVKIFGAGDFIFFYLTLFFWIFSFVFPVIMWIVYFLVGKNPENMLRKPPRQTALGASIVEDPRYAVCVRHFEQDFLLTAWWGLFNFAILSAWMLSYYEIYNFSPTTTTPGISSDEYNSFLRMCGAVVILSSFMIFYIVRTLIAITNTNYIIKVFDTVQAWNDKSKPRTRAKLAYLVIFSIMCVVGFAYNLAMFYDATGTETHWQNVVWQSILVVISFFWLLCVCIYLFSIHPNIDVNQHIYVSGLWFFLGWILINWFWFIDGLTEGYSFTSTLPNWNDRDSYYFSFRVLTNINSGYFLGMVTVFVQNFCMTPEESVRTREQKYWGFMNKSPAVLTWLLLASLWFLLLIAFSIGGMVNWYFLFQHYKAYAGTATGVSALLWIWVTIGVGFILGNLKKAEVDADIGEYKGHLINMALVFFLFFVLTVVNFWVVENNYPAFGHKNTKPASSIDSRTAVGWNDQQLTIFSLCLTPFTLILIVWVGMVNFKVKKNSSKKIQSEL